MKDIDSFVIGIFMGFLICCLVLCGVKAFFTEPMLCEVSMGIHDGKVTHIRYGVFVKGD
jgi:hypothetical protein